jgi:hypothetical protein
VAVLILNGGLQVSRRARQIRYWERRCDKLFARWDALHDPYGLPLDEFRKESALVREAAVISQLLSLIETEASNE